MVKRESKREERRREERERETHTNNRPDHGSKLEAMTRATSSHNKTSNLWVFVDEKVRIVCVTVEALCVEREGEGEDEGREGEREEGEREKGGERREERE